MAELKLGIPKGSLEAATLELFAQAGWTISGRSRNYFPSIDDREIRCSLVRAQEMGPYVAAGTLDAGLTGIDWLRETDADAEIVCPLVYSRASDQAARWVLIVREESPVKCAEDLRDKSVATELVNVTRRYFVGKGVPAEVRFSWGATEAKVVEGLADAAVELTETGSTIRAHGLRIVDTVLETHTALIANRAALADPARRSKIDQLALMLTASLDARSKVLLKMNVPADRLAAVTQLLPSLQAPTVSPLADGTWHAVESVAEKAKVRSLIPLLKAAGAEGILEIALNKIC